MYRISARCAIISAFFFSYVFTKRMKGVVWMIGRLFRRRLVPVFLAAVVLLGAGAVFLLGGGREAAEASAAITDWGLSFQEEGAPPVANATSDYLKNYGALYVGDTEKKEIYITFDAGFENGNTAQILDALKKAQCESDVLFGRQLP